MENIIIECEEIPNLGDIVEIPVGHLIGNYDMFEYITVKYSSGETRYGSLCVGEMVGRGVVRGWELSDIWRYPGEKNWRRVVEK